MPEFATHFPSQQKSCHDTCNCPEQILHYEIMSLMTLGKIDCHQHFFWESHHEKRS